MLEQAPGGERLPRGLGAPEPRRPSRGRLLDRGVRVPLALPAPTVDRAIAGDPATVVVTRADHRELEISLHRRWLGVPLSGRQETPPRAEPSLEVVAPAVRFATRRHAARVHPARAQGPECHPSVDRRGRGLMLLALRSEENT